MTSEQKIWRLSFATSALVHLGLLGFAATIWETTSIQMADGMITVKVLPLENEVGAMFPPANVLPTINRGWGRKKPSQRENQFPGVETPKPESRFDAAREEALTPIEDPFSTPLSGSRLSESDSMSAKPGQGSSSIGRAGESESGTSGEASSSREGSPGESAQPRYGSNPLPEYPKLARQRRHEGVVLLRVRVLADGTVGEMRIERSSGHELLDEAALNAVKHWTFMPAKRSGIPTPIWVTIPIQFSLSAR